MASQEPQRDDVMPSETSRRRLHLREVRSDQAGYDGIGVEMRAARVRAGAELSDIAQKLRISQAYLEAIENGRFDELPGHVYVFGFLKTYARFLDLDEDIVVDRFRTETSGPQRETRLAFPSAMDRGRLPTGRLLLGGLLVAVLAYAGWFVFTSDERSTADRVAAIPERLATPVTQESAATTSSSAVVPPATERAEETPTVGAEPPAAVTPVVPPIEERINVETPASSSVDLAPTVDAPVSEDPVAEAVAVRGTAPVVEPPPAPSAAPDVAEPALTDVAETTVPLDEPGATTAAAATNPPAIAEAVGPNETVTAPLRSTDTLEIRQLADASTAPIGDAATATASETTDAAVTSTGQPTEVASRVAESTPPPLATTEENTSTPDAAGYVPRVFGAGNEDARIVLVADSESWVQVRATSGELLLTRVLRPGDRYLVPDRPGLVMMTGNLGALQVIVDGEVAPSLGPLGVIGRDIPLDADRLRDGQTSAGTDAE